MYVRSLVCLLLLLIFGKSASADEIRFRFKTERWTSLRIENGIVELKVPESRASRLVVISAVEKCGAKPVRDWINEFEKARRVGMILPEPDLLRPGSVLVEENVSGLLQRDRFDRKSAYTVFLAKLESEVADLEIRQAVACSKSKRSAP